MGTPLRGVSSTSVTGFTDWPEPIVKIVRDFDVAVYARQQTRCRAVCVILFVAHR